MGYWFGKAETLKCIVDVSAATAQSGEALCLAYKTTTYSVFAPAYFHDDGYVLAVKNTGKLESYYPVPTGAELLALQASGALPKPLPPYSIPLADVVFGHVLWVAIALTVLFGVIQRARKRQRVSSLETALPPGATPLVLRTKTDRWLAEEAAKLLEKGESVEQQAYGLDHEKAGLATRAVYLVLTNRRLIALRARVGAFGPLREQRGVTSYDRNVVARVESDERHLKFVMTDGLVVDFFAEWSERRLSNQRRFLSDVPRLFERPSAFAPSLVPARGSPG